MEDTSKIIATGTYGKNVVVELHEVSTEVGPFYQVIKADFQSELMPEEEARLLYNNKIESAE